MILLHRIKRFMAIPWKSLSEISGLPGILSSIGIFQLTMACGFQESRFVSYPEPEVPEVSQSLVCPIGFTAFAFHIGPMLAQRCTQGCHESSGNAGSVLAFGPDEEENRQRLRHREDGTALGIFRKARGLVPHVGGPAAEEEDLQRLERWLIAESLCSL